MLDVLYVDDGDADDASLAENAGVQILAEDTRLDGDRGVAFAASLLDRATA
jgi:hypothetical protein